MREELSQNLICSAHVRLTWTLQLVQHSSWGFQSKVPSPDVFLTPDTESHGHVGCLA